MLMPNHKVYILEVHQIHAYYCGLIGLRAGLCDLRGGATFQEDLKVLLNYFNGLLTDGGLVEYAKHTPYADDNLDEYLREDILYAVYQEIERRVLLLIPDYKYTQEIYLSYENNLLYLVDMRRRTYVPKDVLHIHAQRTNQSIPVYSEQSWVDPCGFY